MGTSRWLLICTLPCCFMVAYYVHLTFFPSLSLTGLLSGHRRHYDLLVAVLSARENEAQRRVLRDTWVGETYRDPTLRDRVLVRFVVGSEGCSIPPEDREDYYSCSLLNVTNSGVSEDLIAVVTLSGSKRAFEASLVHAATLALDFTIRHSVVITHLGVFTDVQTSSTPNATVQLFNRATQSLVAWTHFSSESPGFHRDGCSYKPVQQFVLPRGFEGSVVWEGLGPTDIVITDARRLVFSDGGGAIRFSLTGRYGENDGEFPDFRAEHPLVAGSFIFSVHDKNSLDRFLDGKPDRLQKWTEKQHHLSEALQQEAQSFEDILFIDGLVDVYRHLPHKVLKFCTWAVESLDFFMLLKTDDDSYLDVAEILQNAAKQGYMQQSQIWWGSFRRNWAVDHVGKWAEDSYPAPAYPSFACGGAYVLSVDLARWLRANAANLKPYQGEDVSMGIWLAAIGPTRIPDPRWLCDAACAPGMLVSPQLSSDTLYSMWDRRQKCGDPCNDCQRHDVELPHDQHPSLNLKVSPDL
uniref:UDP-GalNAc:beta-1, 3-N-acetylgalactosaminyltransferase 2 n=1 Tax=Myxine glutinosa TaxID=7769 RepID=UPI00358E4CA9